MAAVVADTHVAVWMLLDSHRLSILSRAALQDAVDNGDPIYVSAISLVEVVYLVEKDKLPDEAFNRLATAFRSSAHQLFVVPIDQDIAEAIRNVPRGAIPDMPDRIIAATALFKNLPLVTRDHKIRTSGLSTIW